MLILHSVDFPTRSRTPPSAVTLSCCLSPLIHKYLCFPLQELDTELNIKVLIVGNGMVGKTTLINRFTRGVTVERYKKTIGAGTTTKQALYL